MSNKFPYQIIDLTHTLDEDTPSWDRSCGFKSSISLDYYDCKTEVKFRVQKINMHAGIGTHIDSPAHCVPNGITVCELSINNLVSPCYCIDVSDKMDADYQLSVQDILNIEKQHGQIDKNHFVIIHTGWHQYWKNPTQYHNDYKFPSISLEAAELLLKREIVGIGIDTLSPDLPSSGFPVHKLILGAGKYIIENVANANMLPVTNSYVLAMPIKAAELTEAPIRLIALIPRLS